MNQLLLDQQRLNEIIEQLGTRLAGEWLLVGGALVSIWLEPRRVTEDIDLVGIAGTQGERMALLDAASALGLPIETVNSAADYFVFRIEGWREQIEVLRTFEQCTFYRPTPTLFILLKIHRLSEQDLIDCVAVLARVKADRLPLDTVRVIQALNGLQHTRDERLLSRRAELMRALQTADL